MCVCVYYCSTYYKPVRVCVEGGRSVCLCVYYCSTYCKAARVGGGKVEDMYY